MGDQDLEPGVASEVAKRSRVMDIVFDDKQHTIAGAEFVAIVRHLFGRRFGKRHAQALKMRG